MKSDPICFKHEEILELCEEIETMDFNKPFKRELKKKLKAIMKLTEQAKEDGQNMENRLQKYYECVSDMGFKRIKGSRNCS